MNHSSLQAINISEKYKHSLIVFTFREKLHIEHKTQYSGLGPLEAHSALKKLDTSDEVCVTVFKTVCFVFGIEWNSGQRQIPTRNTTCLIYDSHIFIALGKRELCTCAEISFSDLAKNFIPMFYSPFSNKVFNRDRVEG